MTTLPPDTSLKRVVNHRLEGVPFTRALCQSSRPFTPRAIVVHYTAGRTLAGAVTTLTKPPARTPDGKLKGASAHVVIGRDGEVAQLVAFDRIAWHAGPSLWRGKPKLNDWSIGIELVNLGPLKPESEHMWDPDVFMHEVPEEPGVTRYDPWQRYTEPQLAKLEQVIAALRAAYPSIVELTGHEHICIPRGRKTDPGPAFPWERFGGEPPQTLKAVPAAGP